MSENFTFDEQIAKQYEYGIRTSLPTYEQLFKMIQSYFRANLNSEPSILVVGAGGGKELSTWGSSNSNWKFTGIDPSEAMLNVAKHKVENLNIEDRVDFINGTIHDLSDEKSFDAATCILVLHFIHDREEKLKLLKKIASHLNENSPFVLVSNYGDRNSEQFNENIKFFQSFWIDAGLSHEETEEIKKNVLSLSIEPEQTIIQLLKDAGFKNITRFFTTTIMGGWLCLKGNN